MRVAEYAKVCERNENNRAGRFLGTVQSAAGVTLRHWEECVVKSHMERRTFLIDSTRQRWHDPSTEQVLAGLGPD